ncbi:hypothetical protein ACH5RR_026513 [Cinchona calisaya]|uniref:NusG-like N-terminal domain-containing protein n=1 Tax=Cinchona calisaya TaxID=153742 RepID=A0ABD2Z2Z2_9GENT
MAGSKFLDIEAYQIDSGYEEEGEEVEDDFIIVDPGAEQPEEDDARRMHCRPLYHRVDDQEEDVEAIERRIHERYGKCEVEYGEEATEVERQQIGREREVAVCLMQKAIDKGPKLQIRSIIALDHLKNYIYIEADKEAHVKEAIKGMRNIFASAKIMLVPIKEMMSFQSKVKLLIFSGSHV